MIKKILWLPFFIRWLSDKDLRNSFERLFWTKKEMDEFKLNKIKAIINYAYENVPFYKNLYDNYRINPKHINNLNDVIKLPILTKDMLKKAILEKTIFSKEKRKWKIATTHTTGSTGMPTTLYFDQFCSKMRDINTLRAFFINGIFPDKKFLLLWRRKKIGKKELLKTLLGVFKYIPVVDVMNVKETALGKDKIVDLINEINKFKPVIIRGYVSALLVLSKFIKNYNLRINNLEKIIASAEYLDPTVWNELEEVFCCPVINYYGGTEAAPIACSTAFNRDLIVFEDFYFVEIIDDKNNETQPGKIGRILLTDYYNLYMPIIRYEIGDIAEWSENIIGPFRTFKEVKGRINEVFVLPGGRLLFSHNWHIYFRDLEGLKCFKVIQEKLDLINITLIPFEKELLNKSLPKVQKLVENSLSNEVKIIWNIVEDIKLDKGDKFRAVETKVDWRKYLWR